MRCMSWCTRRPEIQVYEARVFVSQETSIVPQRTATVKQEEVKMYRVITENKNFMDIRKKTMEMVESGFVMFTAKGCFGGVMEKSIVIDILKESDETVANKLAFWIRKHNKQKFIIVQNIPCSVYIL